MKSYYAVIKYAYSNIMHSFIFTFLLAINSFDVKNDVSVFNHFFVTMNCLVTLSVLSKMVS